MMDPALAGLLAECKSNPDDDAPRLILADWLEDHDEPERAEFIRTQVECSRLVLNDPRYPELKAREAELEARHGKEWAAPFARLATAYQFTRGLLDIHIPARRLWCKSMGKVTKSGDFAWVERMSVGLEGAPWPTYHRALQSPHLALVSHLTLRGNRLGGHDLTILLSNQHLGRLHRLELDRNAIDSGMLYLANSPILSSLRILDLSHNRLGGTFFFTGSSLPSPFAQLECLNLQGAELQAEDIRDLVKGLKADRLRTLILNDNFVELGGAGALADCPWLSTCQVLELDDTGLGDVGLKRLSRSPHLHELRRLSLRDNQIGDGGVLALIHKGAFPKLQDLDLSLNAIGPVAISALASSDLASRLTHLDLGSSLVTRNDAAAIGSSTHWTMLQALTLASCNLDGVAAAALADWHSPISPRFLDLRRNDIGPTGMRALAGSRLLGGALCVDISYNDLGDEGAEALVQEPLSGSLARLNLAGCQLGPDAARSLGRSPIIARLRVLDLRSNSLKNDGAVTLSRSPILTSLKALDLRSNAISGDGALALSRSPHLGGLRVLRLEHNRIGKKAAAALRERFGSAVSLSE